MRFIDVLEEQKEKIDVEYFGVASEFHDPQKWTLHELAELLTNPPLLCENCDNCCQSRYLFGRNCACVRQLFNNAEELEAFKQEYPDVYEVVETVSHLQASEKSKVLEERLEALQQREKELIRKDAEKRLMDRHPDFEDIRNSDDFHDWAKSQPNSIQNWIYKNADDADLASRALDLFKKDIGMDVAPKKSNSKQSKKSAADMVSTKTTTVEPQQEKVWTEREIAKMSMAEFDKHEAEISEAMQQGRIAK